MPKSTLGPLTTEAQGWLADCGMRVPALGLDCALKVNRTYDGGWPEFVRADPGCDEAATRAEVLAIWPQAYDILYPAPDPTPTGDPGRLYR